MARGNSTADIFVCNPMRRQLCSVIILVIFNLNSLLILGSSNSKVIELTEDNFDSELERGAYFVKVYAEWCSHCRNMAPAWEQLASELEGEALLGDINGPNERALVSRLHIQGYPSIYLFKDGKAWEYTGPRGMQDMLKFFRKDHLTAEPMPFYKAPNSFVGRILGKITSIPLQFESLYKELHGVHGYSNLSIIGTVLLVPTVLGLAAICGIDAFTTRRSSAGNRDARGRQNRPHAQ
mmetsp:Transcript_41263/g.78860  ORF Transcript_41263/g.78860 Transcript_41263/m.78860 type:complete len:237 (+) Transcript_41263:175-885(+)